MSNLRKTSAGVLACAAGIALLANVASATPAMHALAIKDAVPNAVETVRWGGWHGGGWGGWHGGWHRGWGWGWGGFAAGAIIGSAIASPYYYGGYYYPYGGAYYAPPSGYYGGYGGGGYGGPAGGDASAYCAQRYRSYDPSTGTFLGYDGARHPCP